MNFEKVPPCYRNSDAPPASEHDRAQRAGNSCASPSGVCPSSFIPSLLDLLLAIPEIFGKLVQWRDKIKFEETLELRRAGKIVVTFELSLDCPKRFRYIGGVSKGPSSLLDARKELWEVALHLR